MYIYVLHLIIIYIHMSDNISSVLERRVFCFMLLFFFLGGGGR